MNAPEISFMIEKGETLPIEAQSKFTKRTEIIDSNGISGCVTTFSTFGLESVSLINKAEFGKCFVYMTSSVVFGVSAIFAAVWLTRNILVR